MLLRRLRHAGALIALDLLCVALWAGAGAAQAIPAHEANVPDATAAWNELNAAPFDATKAANVENLTIARDRIQITLIDGTIQFSQAANGIVFGAAFKGRGRIEMAPPNALEEQQLELLAKQPKLDMTFSEATFSFTDDTFAEIAKEVKWTNASDNSLAVLYQSRQRAREDLAAETVPRIFEGLLSADSKRTAYFAADVKTANAGWVLARYDALEPEEVSVGRYADRGQIKLFDTWMSFPAGGASASAAFQNPLAKAAFAAKSYQIDATVTTGADLSATTRVDLQYQFTGERVLQFYLSANLRVTSVKDAQGESLQFFQPKEPKDRIPTYGDYVAVVLPQPTQAGAEASLTFAYAGKHMITKVGAGNYFCPSYGWYPGVENSFALRSNFTMTFHAPKHLTLVATGDKTGETKDGNWLVTNWKSPVPIAVAGFAYGDYKVLDEKVGSIDVQVYANRNPDDFLSALNEVFHPDLPGQSGITAPTGNFDAANLIKEVGQEVGNNLRLFQDYFGALPFDRLAVTNIPYDYGQGWPMLLYLSELSFMDATQRHVLGIQDQIGISDYFRAHEVSHQWWGHEVGWKSYHDQWLSEGFAQFSGNLYVEFRDSPGDFFNRLRLDRQHLFTKSEYGPAYEDLGPVWMGERLASSVAPAGYSTVIYDKGGYILEMLRAMLYDQTSRTPDSRFKALMHDFTSTYAGKAASTEDFKTVVERHMTPFMDVDHDGRMDWFFNEYVYGTGIAQYHLDYTVEKDQRGMWQINGTVTQSGVPEGWKDIVPVYVHQKGKSELAGWLRVTGNTASLRFQMKTKPDKISLNDNGEILAEIK